MQRRSSLRGGLGIIIGLAVAPLAAQDSLELAGMREDIDLLARRVGQLQLILETMERRTGALEDTVRRQDERIATASARLETLSDNLTTRLNALPVREKRLRDEIVAEITTEIAAAIRDLKGDLEAQLRQAAPAPAPETPAIEFNNDFPKSGIQYTVLPGDTVSGIARAHNSRVTWIQHANRIVDMTKLRAGQEIFVPQRVD